MELIRSMNIQIFPLLRNKPAYPYLVLNNRPGPLKVFFCFIYYRSIMKNCVFFQEFSKLFFCTRNDVGASVHLRGRVVLLYAGDGLQCIGKNTIFLEYPVVKMEVDMLLYFY